MNVWEKTRKNSGLTRTEIANAMGISEEKIEQIEKGVREMPTEKVDEYLEKIRQLSSKERKIKLAEAKTWYYNVDLTQKMKEFGIVNQYKLAEILNAGQGSVSAWVNKKGISTENLLKLYYFFNDKFNKIVEEPEEDKIKVTIDDTSSILEEKPSVGENSFETISTTIAPLENIAEVAVNNRIEQLKEENGRLRKQIARYELLIDMAMKGDKE